MQNPAQTTNTQQHSILIVDDERDIIEGLEFSLRQEGYKVMSALDGINALEMIRTHKPDLVLLDVLLPGLNGYDVCKALRAEGNEIPVIMLTAKSTELDTVIGLEIGADDYIAKPARVQELIARIRKRLQKSVVSNPADPDFEPVIRVSGLEIDANTHEVKQNGVEIDLTQREFELLKRLASNPNRVFTREQLLEQVWGWSFIGESRTVDVHIRYLREKLEKDPANPELIKTVRGLGYKLVPLA